MLCLIAPLAPRRRLRTREAKKAKDGKSRDKITKLINMSFVKDEESGRLETNFEHPFFRQVEEHCKTKFLTEQTAGHP